MQKVFMVLALGVFSTAAYAVNPKIVSSTGTFFPGPTMSYYLSAENALVAEAKAFCSEFNETVEKISNINIQLQGEFDLSNKGQTVAVTHPHFIFSALVHCRP